MFVWMGYYHILWRLGQSKIASVFLEIPDILWDRLVEVQSARIVHTVESVLGFWFLSPSKRRPFILFLPWSFIHHRERFRAILDN